MMTHQRARRGFSITELMIAIFVMGVVITQVFQVAGTEAQIANSHGRSVDAQQDARLVTDLMLQNVRMAGFMVPTVAGISSVDGGTSGSDILCISDASVLDDDVVDEANGRFDRAALTADVGAGDGTIDVAVSEMDIDADGSDDFTVDRGVIISNGTFSHCARITGISGGQIDFTPVTPSGFSTVASGTRAVPAVIFELSSSGLMRNNLLVSTQVEDIQIQFAVDANDDGSIGAGEFPIHDLNASVPSLVKGLQLSIMTRTSMEDPNFSSVGRRALGNRNASGTPDSFRRRVVEVNAALRNLL